MMCIYIYIYIYIVPVLQYTVPANRCIALPSHTRTT